jgi:hypothetical protein
MKWITHREAERKAEVNRRLIETACWHTLRYDALRVSLANRASFMVSANAVLIAGISFLFSWFSQRPIYGGRTSSIIVGAGMLVALIYSLLSMRKASQALLSSRSWRKIYADDPAPSLFYQHSDTV